MWMTYRIHFEFTGNPADPIPTKFSDIRFWPEEIEALRWANAHNQKAIKIETGLQLR